MQHAFPATGRAAGQFDQTGQQKGGVNALLPFPEEHVAPGKSAQPGAPGQGQTFVVAQDGKKAVAESRQYGL